MGHRAEKQQRQRREITANAIALVQRSGVSGCRVQDIAAGSGISPATFFNYFQSKESVFREWLDDQLEALFEAALRQHAEGVALRRVLRQVARRLAELAETEPVLCRAAARSSLCADLAGQARGRVAREASSLRLLEQARDRDEIRGDVEPKLLATVLRSTLIGGLAAGLGADPTDPLPALSPPLRGLVDLLVDGLRKRNERVQPAAGGRESSPQRAR
ncbi:MAG: TetR/AcrR family transcriptional regulator [Myxococcota bacterium]|nr:TetR/AcrR family transcriptional regulator [Myxococcota bacterium]